MYYKFTPQFFSTLATRLHIRSGKERPGMTYFHCSHVTHRAFTHSPWTRLNALNS